MKGFNEKTNEVEQDIVTVNLKVFQPKKENWRRTIQCGGSEDDNELWEKMNLFFMMPQKQQPAADASPAGSSRFLHLG